ncbi:alginate export family protein [Sphingopyxis sp. Geo48]|uniref:alginate export family protein n=1 Tax=Sphingopyxis sp. Geo48 TaxID=545241 RepID=UPI0024B84201|nr:alginate export family protein [Sphingopyxis sp. Geo48]
MRLLLLLAALAPATAFAQSVEQTNLRYDEDWSVLRDAPREGWRQAKYVPLGDTGDAYLTLGGEARARFEGFDNNLWGSPPASDDGYLWLRVMPHADLHAGPARVFVQGIAGHARGVGAGKGPADETGIDLLQGFGDLRLTLGTDSSLTLRGGRELMALGSERLVGIRYGPNIPQAFDGVRAIAEHGAFRVDAFHLRPVAIGGGDFDDKTSKTRRLDGIYTTLAPARGIGVDAYWLGYADDGARFTSRSGRETRDTFGLRFFGKRGALGWNWEAMLQRGHFDGDRIRAWSLATETALSFPQAPLAPRLRLRANIASGDRHPADGKLGTFNALFPKGKYFGELSPIGPRNIVNLHPSVDFDLGKGVTLELVAVRFWRESRGDGIYDIPGGLLRPAGGSRARHIGDQAEISVGWQASETLSFSASLSAFRAGAFLRDTGPARTIRMVGAEAMLKL